MACATVAQLVEQGIRNAQVCGSIPHGGSISAVRGSLAFMGNPVCYLSRSSFIPFSSALLGAGSQKCNRNGSCVAGCKIQLELHTTELKRLFLT